MKHIFSRKLNVFFVVLLASVFSVITVAGTAYAGAATTGTYSGKGGKANGKDSFDMYCIACHGETGKGDGPLAESLGEGIKPRNLTDKSIMSTRSDKDLFKVIKFGGAASGFSEAMPAQGGAMLTDKEINNIILYIRADFCKCKGK